MSDFPSFSYLNDFRFVYMIRIYNLHTYIHRNINKIDNKFNQSLYVRTIV